MCCLFLCNTYEIATLLKLVGVMVRKFHTLYGTHRKRLDIHFHEHDARMLSEAFSLFCRNEHSYADAERL